MSFSEQVGDRPPFVGHVGGFSLPVCQLSRGGQRGRKLLPGWRRCGTRRPEWGLELLGLGLAPLLTRPSSLRGTLLLGTAGYRLLSMGHKEQGFQPRWSCLWSPVGP